jgi:hypothetical protein
MTEQQQPDSDAMASDDAPVTLGGSNGSHPDGAIAVADITSAQAVAPIDPTTPLDALPEVADADPEQAVADAAEAAQDAAPADDGTAFMADLARAMQQTADAERQRVHDDIERRRAAHLETIRARREAGEASMQELAAADLKSIDDWAQEEHQRINLERKERAAALQEDLDASLAEHGSRIDAEIEGVEAAIAGYRTEVDAYFATMSAAADPVEIAQLAARRPVFPDLAAVSSAHSDGAGQPEAGETPVGVMDPEKAADPATAWARWNETGAIPEILEPAMEPATPPADAAASGSLLQSVPASRPFGAYRESNRDQ